MATIKSFTDLNQAKVLSKILPLESADMCYEVGEDLDGYITKTIYTPLMHTPYNDDYIPCWSLAALISVLPKEVEIDDQRYAPCLFPIQDKWLLKLWYNSNHTITSPIAIFSDNPIDACYEMIIKLNKLNLL